MSTMQCHIIRKWLTRLIPVLLVVTIGSCSKAPLPQEVVPRVFVSILPQAYFVEKIAGDRVEVEVLVQPGQSPHTFMATTDQMARLAESPLYMRIGVEFEEHLIGKIQATNPTLKIVDMRKGIELRKMITEELGDPDDHVHAHESHEHSTHDTNGHHHTSGDRDPHVWLNPRNVKIMSEHIAEALKELDPAHATEYELNADAFRRELDDVDARIVASFASLRGREFMVFHPAFGYFADAYGLRQLPVEIEGKNPDAKSLSNLIEVAKNKGIRVIFVQPQFSPNRAAAIAEEIGGVVVPMDPLARDYITNLLNMAEKIESVLESRPARQGAIAH